MRGDLIRTEIFKTFHPPAPKAAEILKRGEPAPRQDRFDAGMGATRSRHHTQDAAWRRRYALERALVHSCRAAELPEATAGLRVPIAPALPVPLRPESSPYP